MQYDGYETVYNMLGNADHELRGSGFNIGFTFPLIFSTFRFGGGGDVGHVYT